MPPTRTLKLAGRVGFAAIAVLALARVALAILEPDTAGAPTPADDNVAQATIDAVVILALGALGAVVVARDPRHPIGWLLGLIPLSLGTLVVSDRLFWKISLETGDPAGAVAYAAWLASWVWIPAMVPALTIFPLLFPTGRPLTRRWRPLVWVAVLAGTVMFAGTAFVPGPLDGYRSVVNPVAIDSAAVEYVGFAAFAVTALTALLAIASLVLRFRRSRGTERQQLKWVATAAGLFVVIFAFPLDWATGSSEDLGFATLLFGLLIIAGAVAIAMLRYRLYDIDVVINRALVYGALTALLAGAYLTGVLLLQLALSPLTASNGLAIAVSTLAVAALFHPARRRIQAVVDRRFYRRKYDAARTLTQFGARLRDEVDLTALGDELRSVVAEAMQPAHVSLWLRVPDRSGPRNDSRTSPS